MSNQLKNETSPYLPQHAENPVVWYLWGEDTFRLAWESFEDPETAELLNCWLIAIKVDREERPDVDRLQRRLVGLQTELGTLHAEFPYQLVVNQAVLGGDLRRGIFRDTAADAVRFHQGVVHPRLVQLIGAQKSGHTTADDGHISFQF